MNKTVKTVLKILGYVIAAILGAAGEATMMEDVRCKMYDVLWKTHVLKSLSTHVRCCSS